MFIYFCYKNRTYGAIEDDRVVFSSDILQAKNHLNLGVGIPASPDIGTVSGIVLASLKKPDPDVQILFHENSFEDILVKYSEHFI